MFLVPVGHSESDHKHQPALRRFTPTGGMIQTSSLPCDGDISILLTCPFPCSLSFESPLPSLSLSNDRDMVFSLTTSNKHQGICVCQIHLNRWRARWCLQSGFTVSNTYHNYQLGTMKNYITLKGATLAPPVVLRKGFKSITRSS
jgi:hypothetical protein